MKYDLKELKLTLSDLSLEGLDLFSDIPQDSQILDLEYIIKTSDGKKTRILYKDMLKYLEKIQYCIKEWEKSTNERIQSTLTTSEKQDVQTVESKFKWMFKDAEWIAQFVAVMVEEPDFNIMEQCLPEPNEESCLQIMSNAEGFLDDDLPDFVDFNMIEIQGSLNDLPQD